MLIFRGVSDGCIGNQQKYETNFQGSKPLQNHNKGTATFSFLQIYGQKQYEGLKPSNFMKFMKCTRFLPSRDLQPQQML